MNGVTAYDPAGLDKIMRLHSVTSTIENGFVYLPERAEWLSTYIQELTTFPNGKFDDQADSTSQALDWVKGRRFRLPLYEYYRQNAEKLGLDPQIFAVVEPDCGPKLKKVCPECQSEAVGQYGRVLHCHQCQHNWEPRKNRLG